MYLNRVRGIARVLLATSLLAIPGVDRASAALPTRTTLTIDCDLGEPGEDDHGLGQGETLTVTLVDCIGAGIADVDNTTNAKTDGGATTLTSTSYTITTSPFVFTVFENADIEISKPSYSRIDLDVFTSLPTDPSTGVLLETSSVTFTGSPLEMDIPIPADSTWIDPSGDILLGGNPACDVRQGKHVYTELSFTILTAGTYTFRKIWIDPIEEDLYWGVPAPQLGDSFLAVYSGFNPTSPFSNVVDCNDDIDEIPSLWNPALALRDARAMADVDLQSASGFLLDNQFPWLEVTLSPGVYSLIVMGYDVTPASEWSGTETITYELWGPEGGLTLDAPPPWNGDNFTDYVPPKVTTEETPELLPSTR